MKGLLYFINIVSPRFRLTVLITLCVLFNMNAAKQNDFVLPELTVKPRKADFLHILAFVRDRSTLSSYSDTVTLFREKIVDFAVPLKHNRKNKGWILPRVLKTESYYRFTDSSGKDSVSNRFNQHFSWSDWIGIITGQNVPEKISNRVVLSDTVYSSGYVSESWLHNNDSLSVNVDVLAHPSGKNWITSTGPFFRDGVELEKFRIQYDYDYYDDYTLNPLNIRKLTCSIESRGRGRNMFRFNPVDEPFYVTTDLEIFFMDKEYITSRELKKRVSVVQNGVDIDLNLFDVLLPESAQDVKDLKMRVLAIDHDKVRLDTEIDKLIKVKEYQRLSRTQKTINFIKSIFSH